jgi:hypothetical protein
MGYEAHSQNTPRDGNPFAPLAKEWDDGWSDRERERRRHQLDDTPVPSLIEYLAGK